MAAIRRAALPCRMLPDGMTVRIDASTAFEPDALVYCGARAAHDDLEIPNPVVIVEVFSPTTRSVDLGSKLSSYFRIASVMHYLLVDPVKHLVVHHKRGEGGLIETRIASDGVLTLEPPGLRVPVADLFSEV